MLELVLRIGFSLLVVLGLMWGLAKLARRPLTGNRGTGNLTVLTRTQLSRTSSVAVVQVVDRAYLLGVTDVQINMLAETELSVFERHPHHHHVDRREPIIISADAVRWEIPDPPHDHAEPHEHPKPHEHPEPVPLDDFVLPPDTEPARGPLAGSVLSSQTWNAALDFLRERTARH